MSKSSNDQSKIGSSQEAEESPSIIKVVCPALCSRVLYSQPVVLVTGLNYGNCMPLTWFTPTNNRGDVFISMHRSRYTAQLLLSSLSLTPTRRYLGKLFRRHNISMFNWCSLLVLNIVTSNLQEIVRQAGSCSGHNITNKIAHLGLTPCAAGYQPLSIECKENQSESKSHSKPPLGKKARRLAQDKVDLSLVALKECCAHVICRINKIFDDESSVDNAHLCAILFIERVYIKSNYWINGKILGSMDSKKYPPCLSFLGSGIFAEMKPCFPE